MKKCKEKRASGILADATVNTKSKPGNLPDFRFWSKWALQEFGETMDRFYQLVQDSCSFSKLFVYDAKLGKTISLQVWYRIIKLWEKMDQISAFKLSTELYAIYHYQMDNKRTGNNQKKIDLIKHFGQGAFWPKLISPWDLHPSKQEDLDKLRRGPGSAFLAILFHSISSNCKIFVASCEQRLENLACTNSGLTGLSSILACSAN